LVNSPINLAGTKKELKYEVGQRLLANIPNNLAGMKQNKKYECRRATIWQTVLITWQEQKKRTKL
jgi:hypothetical protein